MEESWGNLSDQTVWLSFVCDVWRENVSWNLKSGAEVWVVHSLENWNRLFHHLPIRTNTSIVFGSCIWWVNWVKKVSGAAKASIKFSTNCKNRDFPVLNVLICNIWAVNNISDHIFLVRLSVSWGANSSKTVSSHEKFVRGSAVSLLNCFFNSLIYGVLHELTRVAWSALRDAQFAFKLRYDYPES